MFAMRFQCVVTIRRQWLIKDWNQNDIVVVRTLVVPNSSGIPNFQNLVLRERQLLEMMSLQLSETTSRFGFFILDNQNTRIGTLRRWQRQSRRTLIIHRQRPCHIHFLNLRFFFYFLSSKVDFGYMYWWMDDGWVYI